MVIFWNGLCRKSWDLRIIYGWDIKSLKILGHCNAFVVLCYCLKLFAYIYRLNWLFPAQ